MAKSANSTTASANPIGEFAKDPHRDPIVAIGEKMVVAIRAIDSCDNVDAKEALTDYQEALAVLAMSQPATTLNGAMIQTSLLLDAFFDREENKLDENSINQLARRFRIAALSVISVLSEHTGRDPGYFGLNWGDAGPFAGTIELFKKSMAQAAEESRCSGASQ